MINNLYDVCIKIEKYKGRIINNLFFTYFMKMCNSNINFFC